MDTFGRGLKRTLGGSEMDTFGRGLKRTFRGSEMDTVKWSETDTHIIATKLNTDKSLWHFLLSKCAIKVV